MRTPLLILMVLLLTTCLAAGPSTAPATAPADEVALGQTLSHKIPVVNLTGRPLSAALEFIQEAGRVNLVVNWRELEQQHVTDRSVVRCSGRDMPLADVLRQVLDSAGQRISYTATAGAIYVTSKADLFARPRAVRVRGDDTEASARVNAALDKPLPDVDLKGVPLRRAFEMLGTNVQVPIEVNWDSLNAAGVDGDQPVTLQLKRATGAQVLQWIIRPLEQKSAIGFSVREGKVIVSSAKDLKKR